VAVGPAAAGPAAAGSAAVLAGKAAVSGLSGFATGTNYVLNSGLAMIHRGEAIIPAAVAAKGSGPYSGAGNAPTVNISYTQNGSIPLADFKNNARQMAKIIAEQFNLNPSLRPAR
jgi:hypothetical protein